MLRKINLIMCVLVLLISVGYADSLATPTDLETAVTSEELSFNMVEPLDVRVEIWSDLPDYLYEGDPVHLYSIVYGAEGLELHYQWEYDKHDGLGWQPIPYANEPMYTIYASIETLSYDYRLIVYYRRK